MKDLKSLLFLENTNHDWSGLHDSFEWIRNMQGCEQDSIHHAEGDVAVHTNMVVNELFKDQKYKNLQRGLQSQLYASALLHDVAKPITTIHEADGRITSAGHAKKGEYLARTILMDLGVDFKSRERISKLVRYHGLPIWFLEKKDPLKAVIECSLQVETDLLSILVEADMKGRICGDLENMLMQIELFKMFCQESGCWGHAKNFSSDHSRFTYFHKEDMHPDTKVYDDTKFEVTILCGIPGSGKDTWIKKNMPNVPSINLDDIRKELNIKPTAEQGLVIQTAKERSKEFMRSRKSFIWNGTNVTRQMRGQLIDLFSSYGGRIRIVYLNTPFQTILKQNNDREAIVPERVLFKLRDKLEVPNLTECHELIIA
jgi:predicted kinase